MDELDTRYEDHRSAEGPGGGASIITADATASQPMTLSLRTRTAQFSAPTFLAALPAAAYFVVLLGVPLVILAFYSVLTSGLFEATRPFTVSNYVAAVDSSVTASLALNSAIYGLATAAVTVVVAVPVAAWLRFTISRFKTVVLFLITASIFASYLVRIYAWRTILDDNGVINTVLRDAGIIHHPVQLLYDRFAVVVALVHIFLPYVVLLIYAALAPVTPDYLEAAVDLGASGVRRWTHVIIPLIAAPAVASFVFVFVRSAGDYVTPQFLGATNGSTLGVLAKDQFTVVGNWGYGAAISILMLAAFAGASAILSIPVRLAGLHKIRFSS
jgi:spermidine/putrescine transport system permease protein